MSWRRSESLSDRPPADATGSGSGGALRIGIAGAGLVGRLLAWQLSRAGHSVSVFDPAPDATARPGSVFAAGFSAAGMLSPLAELENGSARVAALGWRSIESWRRIVASLIVKPAFETRGSLLLAHRSDLASAHRILARVEAATHMHSHMRVDADSNVDASTGTGTGTVIGDRAQVATPRALSLSQLAELEPSLSMSGHAWLLEGEGHIDAAAAMAALHEDSPTVRWHWNCSVSDVGPGRLIVPGKTPRHFDLAIDARGVGARPALPVRGVRGETVWLHAPGHGLTRPVRLLHPRHRVYLVPRPGDVVLVGASEIESEDRSGVSLKSVVELLSAAHSVMPSLAEARIVKLESNLRPALPDNEPLLHVEPGLLRINGLFRHGWLVAPALIDDALLACGVAVQSLAAIDFAEAA